MSEEQSPEWFPKAEDKQDFSEHTAQELWSQYKHWLDHGFEKEARRRMREIRRRLKRGYEG